MLASLVFDTVLSLPSDTRAKPISVVCTDTRVEIPAIVEMVEGTLERMRKCSLQHNLNVDANLLKPTVEESFWVKRNEGSDFDILTVSSLEMRNC